MHIGATDAGPAPHGARAGGGRGSATECPEILRLALRRLSGGTVLDREVAGELCLAVAVEAMRPGDDNTFSFTVTGKPGGTAPRPEPDAAERAA